MYKLSTPKLPRFINRTVLLLVAGALIFSAVVAFGIVRKVQAERAAAVQTAVAEEKARNDAQATHNRITVLEASLKAEKAERASICDYIRSLSAKNPRVLTVPPLCQLR